MRFAGIKELKQQTMDLIKASEKEDIIITAYGKPAAVIHHITEEDLANYLIENDPGFKARIEESYAAYRSRGGMEAGALIKKMEKKIAKKV